MIEEKLAYRIKQLINITETLLLYAQKLKELHDKHLPNKNIGINEYKPGIIPLMLRFLHCTLFYDALLNLNTLLQPFQRDLNKKEQSIFELIELGIDSSRKNESLETANELRKKLEDKNFHNWRHKLVGHKDIESAGDTEIMYLNFIKDEYIAYSIELLNEINAFVTNNYDVIRDNTFAGLYSKSFARMIELFENDIKQ